MFVLFCYALLCVLSSLHHLEDKERAVCFAFIVLQMYCYCECSVSLRDFALGWSAVCDCGISLSYSITF